MCNAAKFNWVYERPTGQATIKDVQAEHISLGIKGFKEPHEIAVKLNELNPVFYCKTMV